MGRRGWLIGGLLLAGPLAAEPRPAHELLGTWDLSCPADANAPCLLRHQSWILPPGGARPTAAVEVQRRGDALVPVIALRGLPLQAALGGAMTVQASAGLRFDNGPPIHLRCGLDAGAIQCAPEGRDVATAGAALPSARTLTVEITLAAPGLGALPPQGRTLELAGTTQALARYRAAGAAGEVLPEEPGLDWQGFIDRLLRAAGFQHGVAGLSATLLR